MKYITLIIGLLVVGCGEFTESTPTTTEKPVKELTLREKVVGTYEIKEGGETLRAVFLANGFVEDYENGKKLENKSKWKIAKGELHVIHETGYITVHRINKDSSMTLIAKIVEGKRTDNPREEQFTAKKIK